MPEKDTVLARRMKLFQFFLKKTENSLSHESHKKAGIFVKKACYHGNGKVNITS